MSWGNKGIRSFQSNAVQSNNRIFKNSIQCRNFIRSRSSSLNHDKGIVRSLSSVVLSNLWYRFEPKPVLQMIIKLRCIKAKASLPYLKTFFRCRDRFAFDGVTAQYNSVMKNMKFKSPNFCWTFENVKKIEILRRKWRTYKIIKLVPFWRSPVSQHFIKDSWVTFVSKPPIREIVSLFLFTLHLLPYYWGNLSFIVLKQLFVYLLKIDGLTL